MYRKYIPQEFVGINSLKWKTNYKIRFSGCQGKRQSLGKGELSNYIAEEVMGEECVIITCQQ